MTASAEPRPAETESPSATPSSVDSAADDSAESALPPWAWVVLGLLVLVLALGVPLIMRARRRQAWHSELAATETEVAWLARELVPSLRRTGSIEGAVGAWTVTSARVVALEDRLTGLEGQAPDDVARERARSLRDAVRAAKARLDGLAAAPTGSDPRPALDEAVDVLETALRPSDPVQP